MSAKGTHIVVFDGLCHLCSGSVLFILQRDPQQRFCFAASQSETGRTLLTEHGIDPNNPLSFLLIADGVGYTESDAALRIAARLRFPWPLAGIAQGVPRPLRDLIYRWVARNRYRWFGQRDVCMMPRAEWSDRFL